MGRHGSVRRPNPVASPPDGVATRTDNTGDRKDLDPEIDLDVVAGQPPGGDYRYAITNSFGLGGHNVAVAFGAY